MTELLDKTIENVRYMDDEELEAEGWADDHHRPAVLVLDDGTTLYASCDGEGNAPGMLFGATDEEMFFVDP